MFLVPRLIFRILVAVIVMVVVAGIAAVLWVRLAPVKPKDLTHSVAGGVGGSAVAGSRCRRHGDAWRCEIDGAEGSGNASTYRVRMRGRRCWSAVRVPHTHANPKLKRRARGCVGFSDRVMRHLL